MTISTYGPFWGSARRRTKQYERLEKGLCVHCGNEKCTCRKFKKNVRKRIPDPLKGSKIVTRGRRRSLNEPVEAETIGRPTLNKKLKGDWARKRNVLL